MHSISQRLSYASFVTAFAFLGFPLVAHMQELSAQEQEAAEVLGGYVAQGEKCFADYKFGSVHFVFDDDQQEATAGSMATIAGKVHNDNEHPLAQGKIIARVSRQDESVAGKNWHPVVYEETLSGDYSLPASGDRQFSFSWNVPNKAPGGLYLVEFFYMAGNRNLMAGIPDVANVSGGSALLFVKENASPQALNFNRGGALLQDKSFEFRAVPPVLAPNEQIKISIPLTAIGSDSISYHLKTALYVWSDTEGKPPLSETNSDGMVGSQEPLVVPFEMNDPKAGVYQLVITATPTDSTILPSIVKIRFSVAGNVPRIVYSGFGEFSSKETLVTVCVANGTEGELKGSLITKVLSDGVIVGENTTKADPNLTVVTLRIPREKIKGVMTIDTQALDENGAVTDSQNTAFTPDLIPRKPFPLVWTILIGVAVGLLIICASLYHIIKKRNTL